MALDSWLTKVRSAISSSLDSVRSTMADGTAAGRQRKSSVGILAFEVASLMSKLLHLWRSLSDAHLCRLRLEYIALPGVRRIVSDDDAFLLGLACAETAESLRLAVESVSAMAERCSDPGLRRFGRCFKEFAESGSDPHRWAMSWKEMDAKVKRMDRYVSATAALYKEMEQLSETEHALRKLAHCSISGSGDHSQLSMAKMSAVSDLQQKLFWQKQEVKYLKEMSVWGRSFDAVTALLARSSFTVLSRIRYVFGLVDAFPSPALLASPLPRSLSLSAAVHPSSDMSPESLDLKSGPLVPATKQQELGFFEANTAALRPPPGTLGAAALSLHYANLVLLIEKMVRSPRSVGSDARDDLYAMLPASVRALLRARLRGVGRCAAGDAVLAKDWRAALAQIVEWLAPLAHNTVRWQAERSFEQRRSAAAPRANVLLLQTLCFASRQKTEAAIVELLVGLNYVWRFEIEMMRARAAALGAAASAAADQQCHLHG
ncbi:hypothetical protein Taro_024419 [Colocasia esculenta]|uniref:Uncharacterized protein n=1 Tax=Colocasia esculenta TaxID=4460 RepID=A0A843VHF1_COLES|nr:hypothetical protein [Colocasia esculenta]